MDGNTDDVRRSASVTSRRAVLKAAGFATVSAFVTTFAPSAQSDVEAQSGSPDQSPAPPQLIESSVNVALESPLVKREITYLQQLGLVIDLSAKMVKQSALSDNLIGLLFATVKTPSPRFGANLVLTVDAKSNLLLALQHVISWSLLSSLEIESTFFNATDPLEIDIGGPNRDGIVVPQIIHPHIEQHWTFPRAEPLPPQHEELVESG
jgi:hypothetical protein